MSKSLSAETTWTVISVGVLLFVVWVSYFFYQQANDLKPGVTNLEQNYNVGVLSEANAPDQQNVYLKTIPLRDIPESNPENITVEPNEVGKTDLSKLE